MTSYHKDFADARALTVETRAAASARIAESDLARFLPDTNRDTLQYEFNANAGGTVPSAQFRAFDTEAPFGSETHGFSYMGKLPAASQKLMVGELQQLTLGGGNRSAAIREALLEKARYNGIALGTRSVIARGQALETGKVELSGENGLTFSVDFLRPASHTVTAAKVWTDITADVIGDLQAWNAVYRLSNGGDAGTIVLSSKVLAGLAKNTSIISAAYPGVTGVGRIAPAAVRQVLADYGFANVIVNDDQAMQVDGSTQRVVSENVVLLLPGQANSLAGGSLGQTLWGVPAEAQQTEYGIGASDQAGIFGGAFRRTDPEGIFVLSSSIFLPVLTNAKATFAATVAA